MPSNVNKQENSLGHGHVGHGCERENEYEHKDEHEHVK
jgi:hypothetical protein